MNAHFYSRRHIVLGIRRVAFGMAVVGGLLAHAALATAVDKFVVSINGSGTICDFDEECSGGTCTSDGTTSCIDNANCPRCLTVANEDLIMCNPVSLGEANTQCRWSLFFSGVAAGLNSKVMAVDILPNGDLIMRVNSDDSIPDISGIKAKDLARFTPKDAMGNSTAFQLPYAEGEWSLFLDGDAVKGASDARRWDSLEVLFPQSCTDLNSDMTIEPQECDVLLSLPGGTELGGIAFMDEDILRCRPTLSAGGTITACEYGLFLDSSQINETPFPGIDPGDQPDSFKTDLFAIEITSYDAESLSGTMLFRAAGGELPSHENTRDLLEMVGSFGPTGACSITTTKRCIADGDCPATETCGAFDTNPSTSTPSVLVFDGDLPGSRVVPEFAAGLGGETIQAFSIVPDGDGDDVPDGIDNCPSDFNPVEICSGGVDSCTTNDDCSGGETCVQLDSDGDGIGDVCDQCFGRPDDECECGDAITDLPSESCDLGTGINGTPASPCSADCQIVGECTQTGGSCEVAEDCPNFPSEGCCGNAIEEGDEECDDGNAINDDVCDNNCQLVAEPVLVLGCEDLVGPNIVPALAKNSKFKDTPKNPAVGIFDKWSVKGEFILSSGINFDPAAQQATIILNQDAIIYEATVPPGTFVVGGSPTRPRWKFGLKKSDPAIPGGEGWRKGKFGQKGVSGFALNDVKYNQKGDGVSIDIDPNLLGGPPRRLRQTIRVGDLCATVVLTCLESGSGKSLKCVSAQDPGSPSGAFLNLSGGLLD